MPSFHPGAFIFVFDDEERAARFERRCARHVVPPCRVRVLEPNGAGRLPQRTARGLVVMANADTPHASHVARICFEAHEHRIPVVLVRMETGPMKRPWPRHPADAVVDVPQTDMAVVEELFGRCFADHPPPFFPLRARAPADVVAVSGDPRPHGLRRALDAEDMRSNVMLPWIPHGAEEQEIILLWFRPRPRPTRTGLELMYDAMPDTTQAHPLERLALPYDARRYHRSITPLDDLEPRARAIASLHAVHGNWATTHRLVADCAVGGHDARDQLADLLGVFLEEPRARSWSGLCELAGGQA